MRMILKELRKGLQPLKRCLVINDLVFLQNAASGERPLKTWTASIRFLKMSQSTPRPTRQAHCNCDTDVPCLNRTRRGERISRPKGRVPRVHDTLSEVLNAMINMLIVAAMVRLADKWLRNGVAAVPHLLVTVLPTAPRVCVLYNALRCTLAAILAVRSWRVGMQLAYPSAMDSYNHLSSPIAMRIQGSDGSKYAFGLSSK